MEQKTFDQIWENQIARTNSLALRKGVTYESFKKKLFKEYEKERIIFHKLMFNKDSLIDRHKIAASISIGILNIIPFITLHTNQPTKQDRLANEILALHTGIYIVYVFRNDEAGNFDRSKVYDLNTIINFPNQASGEQYPLQTLKEFYNERCTNTNKLGNLFLANIYFLLEQYFTD